MKPIIGITSSEIKNAKLPWAPHANGQSQLYIQAIEQAGGVPVILPIVNDVDALDAYAEMIDGLLLSGGNDIEPIRYQQATTRAVEFSMARDEFEISLVRKVLAKNKPVLGICRGMQLINVVYGGTLHQDIDHDVLGALNHQMSRQAENFELLAHSIELTEDSKLRQLFTNSVVEVNSLHHQAIHQLGANLTIAAKSSDGIIEAIEDRQRHFVIGVQSHPEAIHKSVDGWQRLFESFIVASTTNKRTKNGFPDVFGRILMKTKPSRIGGKAAKSRLDYKQN